MGEKIGIDDIITVSKNEGKAKIDVKKTENKIRYKTKGPFLRIEEMNGLDKTGKAIKSFVSAKKPLEKEQGKDSKEKTITREKTLSVIEAALFISPKPLMLDSLARISGVNSLGYVKELLLKLQKEYEERGVEIVNTPYGWHMQVRQDFLPAVAHLTPYSDIPEGCKRTLALVAYKEPIKQAEVIRIQGNKAYTYIKQLVRMGLIKTEKKGKTKVLKLTQEFERYFGEERKRIKKQLASALEQKTDL